ncbi:unnamed protein product [Onchocerca flexuosa]|uniref:Ovule protein n=1 Tax=Onchocerca flexuosa TaxID=387005 RepID=A0A183HZL5_9BILA|nr:unnamed protein product [Onchocerca flexuosa]
MPLPEEPVSIPDLYYQLRGSSTQYSSTPMPLSYTCCDMVRSFSFSLFKNCADTTSTCISVQFVSLFLAKKSEMCVIDGLRDIINFKFVSFSFRDLSKQKSM